MEFTALAEREEGQIGNATRAQQAVPPRVFDAIELVANHQKTWEEASVEVGMAVSALRMWRRDPRVSEFYNFLMQEKLEAMQRVLVDNAVLIAQRLVDLALDEKQRGYSAANACDIALRNMTSGPANVSEAQSRQQMQELERKLDELEGKTPRYLNV